MAMWLSVVDIDESMRGQIDGAVCLIEALFLSVREEVVRKQSIK